MRHGEKVSNQFGVEGTGGTSLAPAFWYVTQTLYAQKEERKIVIITDGRPDCVQPCHASIARMRALGIEVYGIGIWQQFIEVLLPRSSKVIFDLAVLAPAVLDFCRRPCSGEGNDDHTARFLSGADRLNGLRRLGCQPKPKTMRRILCR